MKFFLTMILCSSISNSCMDPVRITDVYYDNWQSCIVGGYEQSIKQSKEFDQAVYNEYKLFFKFYCQELEVGGISA